MERGLIMASEALMENGTPVASARGVPDLAPLRRGRHLADGLEVDPPAEDWYADDWREDLRRRYLDALLAHLRYGDCSWHDSAMLDRVERLIDRLEREATG